MKQGALSTGSRTKVKGYHGTVYILTDHMRQPSRQKQKEALGYTRDNFNYNLQNVQALPQTISKVTAFNFNSKYFPFLQIYKTTDIEKTAVENKIRWNGMSVGRIGTLNEFIREEETFIQAELIRLDIYEDYVVASEIFNELQRGIYVKRSDIE